MVVNKNLFYRIPFHLIVVIGLALGGLAYQFWFKASSGAGTYLTVLTYSSFMSSWGPGPEIAAGFEKEFGIQIKFIDVGDAGLLIQRLKFLPEEEIDVVVGIDQLQILEASQAEPWEALADIHFKPSERISRLGFEDRPESFIPFDWSPLSFVFREKKTKPPLSLKDLLHPEWQGLISLPDPRMSTPGLQFVFFVYNSFGDEEAGRFLDKLKEQKPLIGSSWSTSYGLYQKEKVNLSFSYITSPIYHWREESDFDHKSVLFKEPLPVQIEFAAVPKRTKKASAAKDFVSYLLTPPTQSVIMNKNFMFPVVQGVEGSSEFQKLPISNLIPWSNYSNWSRAVLLEKWKKHFAGD